MVHVKPPFNVVNTSPASPKKVYAETAHSVTVGQSIEFASVISGGIVKLVQVFPEFMVFAITVV